MNQYLENLNKIEFVVTYACTGRCKHCSEGEHKSCGERIDPQIAADAVRKIAAEYDIKTVMTFGGEPLLYPDAVYAIMKTAKELNITKRQVITNGYFSKNANKIREGAERLAACGVNDLLLSVDAFHQETIPLDVVKQFAAEAKRCDIPIRLQPAWLVSATDDNPYNRKTREILGSFADMEIPVGEGNVIFPEGNASKYLAEYFADELHENPYAEDPRDVRCVSFSPNGDVLGGNAYKRDIMEIIGDYAPCGLMEVLPPDDVIYLSVRFYESYKNYYYQTKNNDISIGDHIVVPVGNDGTERIVEVVKKEYYKIDNVPMPLEKVKTVIEKFSPPPQNGPAIDCPALNVKICVDECFERSCMGLGFDSDEEYERFMRICKKCRYYGD